MNRSAKDYRTILGLRFSLCSAAEAVLRSEMGGLVVFPAAPALKELPQNAAYRDALLGADSVFPDSGFMVIMWNLIERDSIRRLSGLAYLRELVRLDSFRQSGNTIWVLPHSSSRRVTKKWLSEQGIEVPASHIYVAPKYSVDGKEPMDQTLIDLVERLHPQHVILGVGGGVQEPLGADLKHRLDYLPAIHCVGAAVSFLTGEQVSIPVWADRLYLGWLFRTLHNPSRFARRYVSAMRLLPLMKKYRNLNPSPVRLQDGPLHARV
ncbi:WecB/TagA/CpsF family glycosyltransferase [Granulicella paludicola]|uniref:WecB/TagA/CpsF family glycosyltransferase n=1 Tax=Granulicella paludicola TaxID=474951 RepID=UPI0021E008F4|nr:WecB/TagA/CpsF family glycosyltransferase [Granulicella paludicola]